MNAQKLQSSVEGSGQFQLLVYDRDHQIGGASCHLGGKFSCLQCCQSRLLSVGCLAGQWLGIGSAIIKIDIRVSPRSFTSGGIIGWISHSLKGLSSVNFPLLPDSCRHPRREVFGSPISDVPLLAKRRSTRYSRWFSRAECRSARSCVGRFLLGLLVRSSLLKLLTLSFPPAGSWLPPFRHSRASLCRCGISRSGRFRRLDRKVSAVDPCAAVTARHHMVNRTGRLQS